jgi:NADH dehydrogenase (ubiquinone) Fe-S protein 5
MPVAPFIKSPLTDIVGSVLTHQHFGRCAALEIKVVNCYEAYGYERAELLCSDIIDDFKECFLRDKQNGRFYEMKKERYRQYIHKERTKKELYAPSPRIDSYGND